MNIGIKYINNAMFYTLFKKHYCPNCKNKLKLVKKSKTVNSNSPEAKNYDFNLGDGFMEGNVKFVWKEFECAMCQKEFTVNEIRSTERVTRGRSSRHKHG